MMQTPLAAVAAPKAPPSFAAFTHVSQFFAMTTASDTPTSASASLFERFHRSEADHNRESGGSGLGLCLCLCREIATAHGGRIELSRAEPDWTEFSVRLPRLGE